LKKVPKRAKTFKFFQNVGIARISEGIKWPEKDNAMKFTSLM